MKAQPIMLEDVRITGDEHEMMLDKNSNEIAKLLAHWPDKNVQ